MAYLWCQPTTNFNPNPRRTRQRPYWLIEGGLTVLVLDLALGALANELFRELSSLSYVSSIFICLFSFADERSLQMVVNLKPGACVGLSLNRAATGSPGRRPSALFAFFYFSSFPFTDPRPPQLVHPRVSQRQHPRGQRRCLTWSSGAGRGRGRRWVAQGDGTLRALEGFNRRREMRWGVDKAGVFSLVY